MMSQKKGFTSSDVIICFAMPAFWRAFAILLFSLSSYRELSYHINKNPAKQDSPPAAGRFSDMLLLRRSAILPGGLFV